LIINYKARRPKVGGGVPIPKISDGGASKLTAAAAAAAAARSAQGSMFPIYRRHIAKFGQFHLRCLRKIAHIKWQDLIPNRSVALKHNLYLLG